MENKDIKIKEEKVNDTQPQIMEEVPVTNVETGKGFMPRKTFILISLLVLITACLLGLALIPNLKTVKPTIKHVVNIDYAQTQLSLSIPTALLSAGYKTDVLISTGKNKVTVVQLELNYDPKMLANVDIRPGTFFTTPTILLKKIDAVNGRIVYILGISLGDTPVIGNGTVATITFSPILGQTTVKTPINFEPKTAVNAVGYVQSVLLKSTGVLFSIAPAPSPTLTK